ncbi:MAG: hypothetical protein JRD02_04155, partial [Deltaproteobacteria bacterium]|nr:hypothetical protein [Deltaproteobacteria bacterium]
NWRGAHNFWWEQLYMSFPLLGGHLYVGRMTGGNWAYSFQDGEDNRDRIKYVRKFGHILGVLVFEKRVEADGTPLTMVPAAGDGWDVSHSDRNAYALGAVVPFSKNVIWKPLYYHIDEQRYIMPNKGNGYLSVLMNALTLKFGNFGLDTEFNVHFANLEDAFLVAGQTKDIDETALSWWLDAHMTFGPAEIAGGFWWIEGSDTTTKPWETKNLTNSIGARFQPLYLFFSEDVGLLFDASGVPNGTAALGGTSGMLGLFMRGAYKISDSMKLEGILAYVEADEMLRGSHWNGIKAADDDLGLEFDLNFEWKFMPNIKYCAGFAYLDAGGYWDTFAFPGNGVGTSVDNDVWALHHKLVINW